MKPHTLSLSVSLCALALNTAPVAWTMDDLHWSLDGMLPQWTAPGTPTETNATIAEPEIPNTPEAECLDESDGSETKAESTSKEPEKTKTTTIIGLLLR
jgi:hypothetical protein